MKEILKKKGIKTGDIVFMRTVLNEDSSEDSREEITEIVRIEGIEGEFYEGESGPKHRCCKVNILQGLTTTRKGNTINGYENEVFDLVESECRLIRKATKKELEKMNRYLLTRAI